MVWPTRDWVVKGWPATVGALTRRGLLSRERRFFGEAEVVLGDACQWAGEMGGNDGFDGRAKGGFGREVFAHLQEEAGEVVVGGIGDGERLQFIEDFAGIGRAVETGPPAGQVPGMACERDVFRRGLTVETVQGSDGWLIAEECHNRQDMEIVLAGGRAYGGGGIGMKHLNSEGEGFAEQGQGAGGDLGASFEGGKVAGRGQEGAKRLAGGVPVVHDLGGGTGCGGWAQRWGR